MRAWVTSSWQTSGSVIQLCRSVGKLKSMHDNSISVIHFMMIEVMHVHLGQRIAVRVLCMASS